MRRRLSPPKQEIDAAARFLGAAGAKRRTPVNFKVLRHDAAPHGYRGGLISVRIIKRERKRSPGVSPDHDTHSTLMRTTKPSAVVRPSAVENESDTKQFRRLLINSVH
jgi:hypothetical protein